MNGISQSIVPDARFDRTRQAIVGFLVASLDEQTRGLERAVASLEPAQLEWQPALGYNTIGMLMAHIAMCEAYWILCAPAGADGAKRLDRMMRGLIGIGADDDGMPGGPDARHPIAIAGKTGEDYVSMIRTIRRETHAALESWEDVDLVDAVSIGSRTVTKGWILYHVLEHLSGHYGQILLIRHQLREAGMLHPERVAP